MTQLMPLVWFSKFQSILGFWQSKRCIIIHLQSIHYIYWLKIVKSHQKRFNFAKRSGAHASRPPSGIGLWYWTVTRRILAKTLIRDSRQGAIHQAYGRTFIPFLCRGNRSESKLVQAEKVPPALITFPMVRPLVDRSNKVWQVVLNKNVSVKFVQTKIPILKRCPLQGVRCQ